MEGRGERGGVGRGRDEAFDSNFLLKGSRVAAGWGEGTDKQCG